MKEIEFPQVELARISIFIRLTKSNGDFEETIMLSPDDFLNDTFTSKYTPIGVVMRNGNVVYGMCDRVEPDGEDVCVILRSLVNDKCTVALPISEMFGYFAALTLISHGC